MESTWIRLLPVAAGLGLSIACDSEPRSAPMRYALNATTVATIGPAQQDQVRGALEMLFGTPQHPGYMRLDAWVEDDFDPNWPSFPADEQGSGEVGEDALAAIAKDNHRRFAKDLEAIDAGRYDAVRRQKSAPDLERKWVGLRADLAEGELDEPEFKTQAKELFAGYYPSLEDSAELYRQQCLHCHGVEGGGDGPTAGSHGHTFLDPLPRDYRRGIFKYTAVKDKARPRRADLLNILDQGIYGTAMPSFRRFSIAERNGLIDYVRLLSIRGEVEQRLAQTIADEEPLSPGVVAATFEEVWGKWQEADGKYVAYDGEIPEPTPELLARGRQLFNDAGTGNCFSCHGEQGLGDGVAAWKVDDAGNRVPAYLDDWGHPIVPRNLRKGIFRFGHRPIDIYRRIYAGINGGPMPAIGESRGADGELLLKPQDLWAIVHYVRSLAETHDPRIVHAPGAGGEAHDGGAQHGGEAHDGGGAGHGAESSDHSGAGAGY